MELNDRRGKNNKRGIKINTVGSGAVGYFIEGVCQVVGVGHLTHIPFKGTRARNVRVLLACQLPLVPSPYISRSETQTRSL